MKDRSQQMTEAKPGRTNGPWQRQCACGNHSHGAAACSTCQSEGEALRRHPASRSAGGAFDAGVPAIVREVLNSPGEPLDGETRRFMEARFPQSVAPAPASRQAANDVHASLKVGALDDPSEREAERIAAAIPGPRQMMSPADDQRGADFSSVRVHTDVQAARSAQALDARAYTSGAHLVFDSGEYAPATSAGRHLLAHELTHVVQQSRASHTSQVQRAPKGGSRPAAQSLTAEEKGIPAAQASGFVTADAAKTSSAFAKALAATKNEKAAEALVKKSGEDLWNAATTAAKAGGAGTDDRQLYWTRLMMTTELRKWNPSWVKDADSLRRLQARLLQLLEQTSRGMTSAAFPVDPGKKRILASGFDPFGFPNPSGDIRQSNLSGAIALALDGETLTEGTVSARVEAAVFPVRYADFDEGIVENYLRPHLTGPNPPHLVMSISQGNEEFELEEFAGRRRSTGEFADNLGQLGGGTPMKPIVPPGVGSGAEFISHTVPPAMLGAMRGAVGRKGPITEETQVQDLPPGATKPRPLDQGPASTPESKKTPGIAVEGSGGGFLSNEIFYRNSLLQTSLGTKVPMIHLHTPALDPGAADAKRNTFIDTARKILRAAVPHL